MMKKPGTNGGDDWLWVLGVWVIAALLAVNFWLLILQMIFG